VCRRRRDKKGLQPRHGQHDRPVQADLNNLASQLGPGAQAWATRRAPGRADAPAMRPTDPPAPLLVDLIYELLDAHNDTAAHGGRRQRAGPRCAHRLPARASAPCTSNPRRSHRDGGRRRLGMSRPRGRRDPAIPNHQVKLNSAWLNTATCLRSQRRQVHATDPRCWPWNVLTIAGRGPASRPRTPSPTSEADGRHVRPGDSRRFYRPRPHRATARLATASAPDWS
jgi:hypothetical protein